MTGTLLQQEVVKKAQRCPDCERIVRALAECDSYPDCCWQILIDGLPNALSRDDKGALHPHQVCLLTMARDAISGAKLQAAQKQQDIAGRRAAASVSQQSLQSRHKSAREAEDTARAAMEAQAGKLRAAEKDFEDAKERLADVKCKTQQAKDNQSSLENRRHSAIEMSTGALQLLIRGAWKTATSRDKALAVLVKFFGEELPSEGPLGEAMPDALSCRPASRSSFFNTVAESVSQAVAKRLIGLEVELQACLRAQDASHELTAKEAHDGALARAANEMIALADARERLESCSAISEVLVSELVQQAAAVQNHAAEEGDFDQKIKEFSAVITLIGDLVVRTCPTPVAADSRSKPVQSDDVDEDSSVADGDAAAGSPTGLQQLSRDETAVPAHCQAESAQNS